MLNDPHFLGLIDAIREEPADDWLRLVLADWLEARDEVEANVWSRFIRDQIAWENLEQKECSGRVFCEGSDWTRGPKRRCPACELVAGMEQTLHGWEVKPPAFSAPGLHLRAIEGSHAISVRRAPPHAYTAIYWDRGLVFRVDVLDIDDWRIIGPKLAALHPIAKTVARRRRSWMSLHHAGHEGAVRYSWSDDPAREYSAGIRTGDDLPRDVWALLDEVPPCYAGCVRWGIKAYHSEDDANAALSRALLKLARQGAGRATNTAT